MNTRKKSRWTTGLIALVLSVPGVAGAEAVLHGRVSFDAGGTMVKGAEESDWSSAAVNTLILPNDTLWVDQGGTAEVEFSGGSFLRMADGSKAEVVSLPPNGTIRGWIGSFYVQRMSRSQGDFVFETPAGAVQVDKDTMVRIDIVSEGITTVSTRWGRATVRTDAGGAVEAFAGKRVFIETGLLPSEPTPYDRSAEDAFDRWNRERAEYLAAGSSQTPVDISYDTLGVSDLDRYGEWVYIDNRPCWRPTVVVDYTPYRYGYWNYVGPVGNVWVGRYPFCYVTSHYGYWDYAPSYGWVWSYDRVWSPAWCATVQYGDYFVWAPVNRFYRPVYPHTSAYFSIGGVSFGYFGTSCARVSDLYLGPSYVHFANYDPFRRYYGTTNININIWNINTGNRDPHVRVPFDHSVTTVRDYTPRRSIRGATTLFASTGTASERVQRLESTSGRGAFRNTDRTGGQFVRTDEARIDRSSRTRNVRLTEAAPEYTRATRSNPVVAGESRGRSADSDGAVLTNSRERGSRSGATVTRDGESTRGTGGRRDAVSNPDAVSPRNGDTLERTPSRGTVERSTSREDTGRTPSRGTVERTPSREDAGRTPSRGTVERTPSREDAGRTPSRGTVERTPSRDDAERKPSRGATPDRTAVPGRTDLKPGFDDDPLRVHTRPAPRTSTRETPDAAPRTEEPSRTRTQAPVVSTGPSTRTTATPERTQARTSAPRVDVAPSRASGSGEGGTIRTATPSRTESTATSRTATRERTVPTVVNEAPQRTATPSRTDASRGSAPTRTQAPRVESPSTSRGTVLNAAPSTRTSSGEPSRPAIRYEESPAPVQDSGRSTRYTAPSREIESPRMTAPSRDIESPRFTAPSRDSGSSRTFTAPSRDSGSSRSSSATSSDGSSSRDAGAARGSGRGR